MSLAIYSRPGPRRVPFSELQICGCCLSNGDDALLSCAKCSVLVHAHCYYDENNDPSAWLCQPCSMLSPEERETIVCCICNQPGGALKATDDDGWAHVCCALWTPETYIPNGDLICGVTDIHVTRKSLRCTFCKKIGGCVQCSFGKCVTSFHLTCACQNGLQLSLENHDGTLVPISICHRHKQSTRKLVKAASVTSSANIREEEAICDVCGHDFVSENNDIVICDGCEIGVHQSCYGIASIPEHQWFCQACSSERPGKCILCSDSEGALKQTTNGDWVHVVCALWSHQAYFLKPSSLDALTGLEHLLLDDPDRQCHFCKDAAGFCCDCAAAGCSNFFHVRCARKDKRRVEIYDLENPSSPLNVLPQLSSLQSQAQLAFVVFCDIHQTAPFSAVDYQKDHPFPSFDNGVNSDNEVLDFSTSPPTENDIRKSRKRFTNAFVDDGKRSQADIFWQDEIQPYFEPPRISALRLSKSLERKMDVSFIMPPLGKISARLYHPCLPSFKSCDWICEQLDIPCVNAQRYYALLRRDNSAIFTNFQPNGTLLNFCLVENVPPDGDLFYELSNQQHLLASQLFELDGFRKKLRTTIDTSFVDCTKNQRDIAALHKDYVDMSHSQIVRLSLVSGFRDLDLAASDFTQEHFNTTCRVCFGTEGTEVNPIVICESCGLAVHKYCYGIEFIPEGDWLCDACSGTSCPVATRECALCPLNGFAFKSCDIEGLTVHLVCALWCPQVQIIDMVKMAPVTNVLQALSSPHADCGICRHDGGITVSCCHLGCFHQFHVTCAWEFGLFMEVKSVEGKPLFNCFCVSHTPEKAGGQQRDRLKQHELRLKARTQKPAQAYRPAESALDNTFSMVSASATPRVLDGEDTYLPDVCAVCFTFSQDDLVKCVNCSIAIHPDCYGTPKNAEQFRCVRCTAQPQRARKISCVYCPRLGGAYERHETSRWRHKACERWALSYRNNGDRLFHHTVCAICDRKEGACIACTANGCSAKFHALCGLFVHCYLHFEDDVLTALCPLHSPIRSDSFNGKDASPDLFVFYDRLRLVRADLDELRTIMDLVKRREKVKKNISALYLQIASEAKSIGKMSPPRDHFGESEEKDVDYMARKAPSGLLEVVLEEDTENGEISCDEIMMLNQNKCSPKSSPISPDRASLDVADGSVVLEDAEQIDESIFFESTTVNPSIDLRLKDLGASNECDNSRIPCQSRENQTVPVSTMNGEGDASEPAVESTSKNDDNTSVQGVGADVSDHREGSSGRAEDAGGDESSDDESKKLAHRDSVDDKPRSRRKAEASSDELEDDEALDSNEPRQKRLVTVEKRPRIGKSAIQFRIKIDRSQLPPSSKVKIKKALLSARSKPSSRGRRLSRSSRQTSSGDESAIISDGSDVEATVRRGRRRSARGTVDSDMDDFTSENVTPARRYTQRTASLAERRAKDSEEASESTNLNRIRWFPDEIEYLNEIVEDLDIDPDWDVVAKMMEDKFGQTFRVYSKNVVQTRWSRSSLGHSRKAVPAAPVVESTSQRTRWPNEELEFLRSLVAHGNDEGKRNWPDIVKQMHRKFGRLYRRYTHQVLQSKVHRLLNTPESSEPKESTRKAAKSSSKSKWANEELEYLRGLVTKFGTDDWVTVANFMDKYLGERYRTYTGPILQKRWRELGPRGQAGPSQEIRDDMVANPEQHAAASPQIDNGHASDNNQEELISEEDFEEALSDGELEHPRTVLKSPVIAAPDDSEMYEEPASAPAELTSPSASDSVDSSAVLNVSAETSNAAEIPASTSEPNQSKAVALKPENSSDTSAAVHTSSMTGSIKKDLLSEPSGIPIEDHESTPTENPAENAMDLDAGPGHVELRSPLAQPAQPLQQPPDLSQTFEETQHTLAGNLSSEPNATRDAEDKFEEEVPWHLEPDEDNVVLRTPMQQASLLFAQSTDDSLFASSFPSYILNQGDVSSDQPKPKGNAWRPDEIDYLNELGSNPSLNKDWELIASKMCDRFGTQYRKGYLAASIKQRWSKANPRTPKSGPATATPTVPRAVTSFKDSRQSFTSRDARGPEPVAVSTDDQNLAKEQSEGLSRTPYNQEELDYLAELVDQFGSKDWTRVAQRMQLRFNDKYRRYVAASLSGKWTRLRSKNQLPANDSESAAGETAPSSEALRLASHFPPESTIHVPDSELLVEPAVEETVEDAIPCSSATPIVEEPDEVPQVVVPKSPLYDQPQAQLDATLVQPLSPVPKNYQDLSSASEQLQSQEINAEPTPSNDFSTVRSAAAPKTRGKTPWSEEEVTFFRTQLLELGKDFKAILPKMTAKFGAAYRQYTLSSLQARWSKMEKFENISPTDVSPMQTADERGLPAVISTHQRSQEEITPAEDHFEIAECTIEAASSKLESRDNVLEEDVVLESPSRRRRSRDEDFDADAQESSKESRRSRRRRAEVSESPPRSSSNGTPTLGLDENLRPGSPVRVRSPRVSQSPTPVDIAVSNAVETSTELEAEVPQSSRMTPSSSRTKAPWLPDELQYLRLTAQKEKFEWNCVAREMNQKFGTERRPKGYTPIAVMTIYRRRFPKDGAPARIKDAPATTKEVASSGADIEEKEIPFPRPKAIKQPKSRGRPAKTLESSNVPHVDLPTTTQTTTQSPDGLGGRIQPSRRAAPSPGRNRTSLAKASPTKRRLLSNETAAIEKLAAVIESDVDSSKAAPRRRRRTELPPSTTPKRRKMSVPGTEPRKPGPSRSRIPNQGVNRLSRLIENIEEHEFPGDQSSKALKFLRSHQSKWKQSRALAPGDRAWVLDSWQFKPYEIKIVQAYDEGDRYRIHYLNWSSKFDEDVSGEFVFQHSPEIRQISSMADTYSKGR